MQYMKCLEHKLLNRDKVEHTNSNKLSWMKNTLTRLMETSNASNAKNCFVPKEDCDNIVELRTVKRT